MDEKVSYNSNMQGASKTSKETEKVWRAEG